MTPTEYLDILIACYVEYEHPPTMKDLFRLRELFPDAAPYSHPIKVAAPALEDEPE